MYRIN